MLRIPPLSKEIFTTETFYKLLSFTIEGSPKAIQILLLLKKRKERNPNNREFNTIHFTQSPTGS